MGLESVEDGRVEQKREKRETTQGHRQQCGDCLSGGREEVVEGEGGQMEVDRDLTRGGEHTIQGADDALWNFAPETCMILLTSVTP